MNKTQLGQFSLNNPPKNICILRLSAIADICHTLAVVQLLQRHLPKTEFTWIIGKNEASLLKELPNTEFIVFDKSSGLSAYIDLHRNMRKRHFDVLLHMQIAFRASIASLLIPALTRIGFDRKRAKDLQWLFTNKKISPKPRQHMQDGLVGYA